LLQVIHAEKLSAIALHAFIEKFIRFFVSTADRDLHRDPLFLEELRS